MRNILTLSALLLATACGTQEMATGEVFGAPDADPDLELARTALETRGSLMLDNGSLLTFQGIETADGVDVTVELSGMSLTAKTNDAGTVLDGFAIDTQEPTLITDEDRASISRLAAALEAEFYPSVAHVTSKAEYDEVRSMTPAEQRLFSAVEGLWAQWPTSMPLGFEVGAQDIDRGITEIHYYADNAYYMGGSHDCWDCDWWEGDCTDYKRIGHEFDGCNHANTGVSCSGTQFTVDARNHDQCVRTGKHGGHSLASAWCNDQFASASDDELFADDADYDWRGSSRYNNCPTSWKGTDDGCDVHCQFRDPDCL
ncbi:MAG: hypothetical protein KC912_23175 [Proteobacteria bacterium]|nr:hypothetical protein [Pseudomonadota bacterium]